MGKFLLGQDGKRLKAQGFVGQNRNLMAQGPNMKGWNVSLPGTAGNYVSAPHNASQTPFGDMKVAAYAVCNNWALSTADQVLFSKYVGPTNGVFRFVIDSSPTPGILSLVITDGVTSDTAICTLTIQGVTGVANGEGLWLSAEYASGSGGQVDFFYSRDSPTMEPELVRWYTLQLNRARTPNLIGAGNTSNLNIGAYNDGASLPFAGKIYRATAWYDLIEDPTNRLFDFKPEDAAGNSSWISKSTGEVWTLNGTASIGYS